MKLEVFQTLADKGNPDYVEENGPFPGNIREAWLGEGYYFWESHIELGHWWGEVSHSYQGYMICQADVTLDKTCWDLYNNIEHKKEFISICKTILENRPNTKGKLQFGDVLNLYRTRNVLEYEAIRVHSQNVVGNSYEGYYTFRVYFSKKHPEAYLDLMPPIQICLLTKRALNLRNYRVVYPTDYIQIYA